MVDRSQEKERVRILAPLGVPRKVLMRLLNVSNNAMAGMANRLEIVFEKIPPEKPEEVRVILARAGYSEEQIDDALRGYTEPIAREPKKPRIKKPPKKKPKKAKKKARKKKKVKKARVAAPAASIDVPPVETVVHPDPEDTVAEVDAVDEDELETPEESGQEAQSPEYITPQEVQDAWLEQLQEADRAEASLAPVVEVQPTPVVPVPRRPVQDELPGPGKCQWPVARSTTLRPAYCEAPTESDDRFCPKHRLQLNRYL